MATKAERKEMRAPDEFQVQASRVLQWIIDHRGVVLGLAAVVIIAAVATWGVSQYQAGQDEKAGAALSEALALTTRPVMGEPAAAQPGIETYANDAVKSTAVLAALERVKSDYSGRASARTAAAEIGFWKLKHGDAAGAVAQLQEFLAQAGKDDALRVPAEAALGAALEDQGKLDDAEKAYGKLAEAGAPESGAYQSARLALLEKKPDAKDQLDKISKDYPKDPVAAEARRTLELADLPPPPPPGSVAPTSDGADKAPAPAPEKAPAPAPAKGLAKAPAKAPTKVPGKK